MQVHAKKLKRVRYSYHRDLFILLNLKDIANIFEKIWKLCEPHMKLDPHLPDVENKSPKELSEEIIDLEAFLIDLSDVIEEEALADQNRGRTQLAALLNEAVSLMRNKSCQ